MHRYSYHISYFVKLMLFFTVFFCLLLSDRLTAAASETLSSIYQVRKGDTLWGISELSYGSGGEYHRIYNANTDTISNPDLIFPGQELTIPNSGESEPVLTETVTISQDAPAKNQKDSSLEDMLKAFEEESGESESMEGESSETTGKDTESLSDKEDNEMPDFKFTNWNEDADSLKAIKTYVEAVTKKDSKDFIPKKDRIAVFDFDGTIFGELCPIYFEYMLYTHRVLEDESYTAGDDMKEIAREVLLAAKGDPVEEGLDFRVKENLIKSLEGMSLSDFKDYVREFKKTPVIGFDDMLWENAFFTPMLEVIDYLSQNGFEIYILTASNTHEVRVLIEDKLDIPASHVIGTDVLLSISGLDGKEASDYELKEDDIVLMGNELVYNNLKANKIYSIENALGARPVLAFGNSESDYSMAAYTKGNDKYMTEAFLVLADDTERDYGDEKKAKAREEKAKEMGWKTISEKNDWSTIYGE